MQPCGFVGNFLNMRSRHIQNGCGLEKNWAPICATNFQPVCVVRAKNYSFNLIKKISTSRSIRRGWWGCPRLVCLQEKSLHINASAEGRQTDLFAKWESVISSFWTDKSGTRRIRFCGRDLQEALVSHRSNTAVLDLFVQVGLMPPPPRHSRGSHHTHKPWKWNLKWFAWKHRPIHGCHAHLSTQWHSSPCSQKRQPEVPSHSLPSILSFCGGGHGLFQAQSLRSKNFLAFCCQWKVRCLCCSATTPCMFRGTYTFSKKRTSRGSVPQLEDMGCQEGIWEPCNSQCHCNHSNSSGLSFNKDEAISNSVRWTLVSLDCQPLSEWNWVFLMARRVVCSSRACRKEDTYWDAKTRMLGSIVSRLASPTKFEHSGWHKTSSNT